MKILVIQLARLGDIYQSWPAVRALKRRYPDASIDMMVRSRFAGALEGLEEISQKIELSTHEILKPLLLSNDEGFSESLRQIDTLVEGLRSEKYNIIVNLSFSPVSSYITDLVASDEAQIFGYSRHTDGFLSIADDVSAYFYAQVGPGRANRMHLSDLFCIMLDIDPINADWAPPKIHDTKFNLSGDYIVLHVGASQEGKTIPPYKWRSVIAHFQSQLTVPIVLIGSAEEMPLAEEVAAGFGDNSVINLAGKTKLMDIFALLKKARLLVGCDSAPIHMASLVSTPALNVSLGVVNFWETGPRSYGSRVIYGDTEADVLSETIAQEMLSLFKGEKAGPQAIVSYPGLPAFTAPANLKNDFMWSLVRAIYMSEPFPEAIHQTFLLGMQRLYEVNELILQQLTVIREKSSVKPVAAIIDQGEAIISAIEKMVPEMQPLIRWYHTEKIRIGPGSMDEILTKTEKIHMLLRDVTSIYVPEELRTANGEAKDGATRTQSV